MLDRAELEAVVQTFGRATPLPRAAFVDPAVLELEQRHLFQSSWIPVAHEADLPRPGDWVRAPLLGEHVVVMRSADLEITALHAVCAHRGTLLVDGERGHLRDLQLRCPYHAWTYATDGTLLDSPGRSAGGPRPALARAGTALRHGVVFVNQDEDVPEMDAGPPWLARAAATPLARVSRTDHEVRANWKLLVGNFQESHHFPSVHPGLEGRTPWRASSSVVVSDAWLGGAMDLAEGMETVSQSGRRQGRSFVAAPEDRSRVLDAWVFPLWLTSLQPDYLLTYRLAPLAADRTLVVAEIQVHPAAVSDDLDDVLPFWERTNAEDRAICELQQRGLEARHPRSREYAASEDGLHAFERIVASRYLRALP
jgi:Rieske 2Fe-2S family protein